MSKQIFFILFNTVLVFHISAKPTKEIQIGLSYNTFNWKIIKWIQPDQLYRYNQLQTNPLLRINYAYNSKKIQHFSLQTFLGFQIMGGKSKSDTSHFKEKYIHPSLEIGIMPSFKITKNTTISIGLKANYFPISIYKYYGTIYQSDTLPRKWIIENVSIRYYKFSSNAGFNIKQQINKFSLSFEAWFGLTNLGNMNTENSRSSIKENNYRLLIGYKIFNNRK